jgi:hypothetical protein
MKKYWIKPGFEVIFALSLIAIMGLPPLVFGQNTKNTEIKIANGDTVVNGKNIKDLSQAERKEALKDIENLGNISGPQGQHRIFIRKGKLSDTGVQSITITKRRSGNNEPEQEMLERFRSPRDSSGRFFKFRVKRPNDDGDSVFTFNYKMNTDPEDRFEDHERNMNFAFRNPGMEFMRHKNVQSFNYTNTGGDGISTHISFPVTDPSPEKLKELGRSEKAALELKDLNLVPEFSSGKTGLMFSLASHAVAEVKFTDHEGKLLWSDKAVNGSFNKSFALGLNGIYFLQVKQAGKVAVKRIVKEE